MIPKPLAGTHGIALAQVADDAAGDQAGDLHHGDLAAVGQAQCHGVAFVGFARLVLAGVEEAAVPVGDAGDDAVGRDAVHVDVEDRQEGGHPPARHRAEAEFRRRHGRHHRHHTAIGGRDHRAGPAGRHALGIAEEEQAEQGEQQAEPGQPWPIARPSITAIRPPRMKGRPAGMGRGEHVADVIDEGHYAPRFMEASPWRGKTGGKPGAPRHAVRRAVQAGAIHGGFRGPPVAPRAGGGTGIPVPLARPRRAGTAGSGGRRDRPTGSFR